LLVLFKVQENAFTDIKQHSEGIRQTHNAVNV